MRKVFRLQVEIDLPLGRRYRVGSGSTSNGRIITVRINDGELKAIDMAAYKAGVNRSQYVLAVLNSVSACINHSSEEMEYEC